MNLKLNLTARYKCSFHVSSCPSPTHFQRCKSLSEVCVGAPARAPDTLNQVDSLALAQDFTKPLRIWDQPRSLPDTSHHMTQPVSRRLPFPEANSLDFTHSQVRVGRTGGPSLNQITHRLTVRRVRSPRDNVVGWTTNMPRR